MRVEDVTKNDCIHVKTYDEYKRIIKIFNIEDECFLEWFYEEDTVLYPFTHQYGEITGVCVEDKFNVIDSELITDSI